MKYENLEVWQRSFRLSIEIYKKFELLKDFGLKIKCVELAFLFLVI